MGDERTDKTSSLELKVNGMRTSSGELGFERCKTGQKGKREGEGGTTLPMEAEWKKKEKEEGDERTKNAKGRTTAGVTFLTGMPNGENGERGKCCSRTRRPKNV